MRAGAEAGQQQQQTLVWDLDTTLPFPCAPSVYCAGALVAVRSRPTQEEEVEGEEEEDEGEGEQEEDVDDEEEEERDEGSAGPFTRCVDVAACQAG